jgi:hypothetical protein
LFPLQAASDNSMLAIKINMTYFFIVGLRSVFSVCVH